MQKMILITLLLVAFSKNPAKLKVIVKNIRPGKGSVVVEIYDDQQSFSNKKPLVSKILKASNESLEFTFSLTEGTYAVKVFQDINENKKCDMNLFHIPQEPYGLSNNFRPKFSAPGFDDCKFNVAGETIQTIMIR
jgi:uncharacterized protein (DUF2141 family)